MSCERNKAVGEAHELVKFGIEDDVEYLETLRQQRLLARELRGVEGMVVTPVILDAQEVDETLQLALRSYENRRGFANRKGEWLPTYSGRLFWLLDPRADEIEPADIARGLARIARFNGASVGAPYSVAQHSYLASYLVPEWCALPALLHDAHEAYIGDQTAPWKRAVISNLKDVEDPIKAAIAERFGFEWTEETAAQVKEADLALLATEARDLVPSGTLYMGGVDPLQLEIEPLGYELAEYLFSQRLTELTSLED